MEAKFPLDDNFFNGRNKSKLWVAILILCLYSLHKQHTQRFRCILENRTLKSGLEGHILLKFLLFLWQDFLFDRTFRTWQYAEKYNIIKMLSAGKRFERLISEKASERESAFYSFTFKKSLVYC